MSRSTSRISAGSAWSYPPAAAVRSQGGLFTTPEAGHIVAGQGDFIMFIGWVGQSTERFISNISKVVEFRMLPFGWDGRRGYPLSDEALQVAVNILTETADASMPSAQLVPLPSGGVQIEWHVADNDVELEIDAKGALHLFADTADGDVMYDYEASPVFLDSMLKDLRRTLRRLGRILEDARREDG